MKLYIEGEGVDCDFVITRACDVHFSSQQHEKTAKGLRKLQQFGVPSAQEAFEVDAKKAETASEILL